MDATCIHCRQTIDYRDGCITDNPDCWDAPRRPCQQCGSNGEEDPGCCECDDTGNSWMGLHEVDPRAVLGDDAIAVIAGLVADDTDVNAQGIMASDEVWDEIRAAFPLDLFRAWVTDSNYVPEAGE